MSFPQIKCVDLRFVLIVRGTNDFKYFDILQQIVHLLLFFWKQILKSKSKFHFIQCLV